MFVSSQQHLGFEPVLASKANISSQLYLPYLPTTWLCFMKLEVKTISPQTAQQTPWLLYIIGYWLHWREKEFAMLQAINRPLPAWTEKLSFFDAQVVQPLFLFFFFASCLKSILKMPTKVSVLFKYDNLVKHCQKENRAKHLWFLHAKKTHKQLSLILQPESVFKLSRKDWFCLWRHVSHTGSIK